MLLGGPTFSRARDCPCHSWSLLKGWHGPPWSTKSSPPLPQQADASRLYVGACRDLPTQPLPSRPALPSPHSPSSAGTQLQQLWRSEHRVLSIALVSVCSASSHAIFTSAGASAICCATFIQLLGVRCQCVFGSSLPAPREMICPWRGALVVSVQARTSGHPCGRPELLLRSQARSHSHWHTLPRLPTTCCSWMAWNCVPGTRRGTLSKGRWASSSVLQEGTSSAQVPRDVCSAVMLPLPQAMLPSW